MRLRAAGAGAHAGTVDPAEARGAAAADGSPGPPAGRELAPLDVADEPLPMGTPASGSPGNTSVGAEELIAGAAAPLLVELELEDPAPPATGRAAGPGFRGAAAATEAPSPRCMNFMAAVRPLSCLTAA